MSPSARLRFTLRVLLGIGIIIDVLLPVVFVPRSMSRAGGTTVNVWLTTSDGSNQLTAQPSLTFISDSQHADSSTIDVIEHQQFQQMDGFGAAVTDSSAWLMYTRLSTSQRNELMKRLFDPADGIGISFVRIPMSASDFSVNGPYSYDNLPPGQTDPMLSKFSINHDTAYILPLLKQAVLATSNTRSKTSRERALWKTLPMMWIRRNRSEGWSLSAHLYRTDIPSSQQTVQ